MMGGKYSPPPVVGEGKRDDNEVNFDGDFECGNIDQVRKRSPIEYDIWIRNDTNGSSNLQWFYFRMTNIAGFKETIRINIVNFTKGNSLFYYGMKPSIWSNKAHNENGIGWYHGGTGVEYDISPYHVEINKMNPHKPKSYYCCSFSYTFEYEEDEVYIAYTIPYTYT